MKDRESIFEEILTQFLRVVNKINRFDDIPQDYGIDESITPATIHTIEAVGKNEGINVTQLAEKLGVTKGAVSQMVGRLTRRGFLVKRKKADQEKEMVLSLTDKGRLAFNRHEDYHRGLYREFMNTLSDIDEGQVEILKRVLDTLESHIDTHIK